MFKFVIPFILFILVAIFLAIGLKLKPSEIPSPFIGKPAPAFSAAKLETPNEKLTTADFKDQVWLFNVWASWCVSCRAEHPVLNQLAEKKTVAIVGLNYKDDPNDARNWLAQLGNPYDVSVTDRDGRIGIDWGVYGVPETFVIDKKGVIRHKFTGPLTAEDVQQILLPMLDRLQAEAA